MIAPNTLTIFIIFAAAAFSSIAFLTIIRRHREFKRQELERIIVLQQKIDTALQDGSHEIAREAFNTTLQAARLTTGLQLPRLQNLAKIDKQAPEKYKILGKLASQGMNADEIASILGISRIEAGQLLSLSNMTQCGVE